MFALNDNDIKQYAMDAPWLGSMYRMHGFRTTASPVWGLTADVLVCAPHFCPFATFFPFFLTPDFPASSLRLMNCANISACGSWNRVRAQAGISEVGSRPMEHLCEGSASSGSWGPHSRAAGVRVLSKPNQGVLCFAAPRASCLHFRSSLCKSKVGILSSIAWCVV